MLEDESRHGRRHATALRWPRQYHVLIPTLKRQLVERQIDSSRGRGHIDVGARREIMARLPAILQEDGPIVQPLWRSALPLDGAAMRG